MINVKQDICIVMEMQEAVMKTKIHALIYTFGLIQNHALPKDNELKL